MTNFSNMIHYYGLKVPAGLCRCFQLCWLDVFRLELCKTLPCTNLSHSKTNREPLKSRDYFFHCSFPRSHLSLTCENKLKINLKNKHLWPWRLQTYTLKGAFLQNKYFTFWYFELHFDGNTRIVTFCRTFTCNRVFLHCGISTFT